MHSVWRCGGYSPTLALRCCSLQGSTPLGCGAPLGPSEEPPTAPTGGRVGALVTHYTLPLSTSMSIHTHTHTCVYKCMHTYTHTPTPTHTHPYPHPIHTPHSGWFALTGCNCSPKTIRQCDGYNTECSGWIQSVKLEHHLIMHCFNWNPESHTHWSRS